MKEFIPLLFIGLVLFSCDTHTSPSNNKLPISASDNNNYSNKDSIHKEVKPSPKEYIKKWLELDLNLKQSYIEENIIGTWSMVIEVGFKDNSTSEILKVNRDFKTAYKKQGDYVGIESYSEINPETKRGVYSTENIYGDGKKDNFTTSYLIENNNLRFPEDKAALQDVSHVVYISKNMMIVNLVVEGGFNSVAYYARFDNGVLSDYTEELSMLLKESKRDKIIMLY